MVTMDTYEEDEEVLPRMYKISKGSMSMFGYIFLPVTLEILKDFVARVKCK